MILDMQKDFRELSEKPNKPIVYMDSREDPAMEVLLGREGALVKVKTLEIGDYIVSDRAVVERKTRSDFENSIVDGRLFDQATTLSSTYDRIIYIIEGSSFSDRINRKALMAAISSLILNFGAAIFFTPNMAKSAELIVSLATKEQIESNHSILIKKPSKSKDERLELIYIVSSLPGIGDKTAIKLLDRFETLSNLFNASEQELSEIPRIGKKRARYLSNLFRKKWKDLQGNQSS